MSLFRKPAQNREENRVQYNPDTLLLQESVALSVRDRSGGFRRLIIDAFYRILDIEVKQTGWFKVSRRGGDHIDHQLHLVTVTHLPHVEAVAARLVVYDAYTFLSTDIQYIRAVNLAFDVYFLPADLQRDRLELTSAPEVLLKNSIQHAVC